MANPVKRVEPAAIPMYAVEVYIHVKALKNIRGLKKGDEYYVGMIRRDGLVSVIGHAPGEWYPMDMFVQMLTYVDGNLQRPKADTIPANENAKD